MKNQIFLLNRRVLQDTYSRLFQIYTMLLNAKDNNNQILMFSDKEAVLISINRCLNYLFGCFARKSQKSQIKSKRLHKHSLNSHK